MTPEDQRVAIAKAVGWTELYPHSDLASPDYATDPQGRRGQRVPMFCKDLNAMHEAEKVLSEIQEREYVILLCRMFDIGFNSIHATSAQRAEAFLKTLGLWKPSSVVMEKGQS